MGSDLGAKEVSFALVLKISPFFIPLLNYESSQVRISPKISYTYLCVCVYTCVFVHVHVLCVQVHTCLMCSSIMCIGIVCVCPLYYITTEQWPQIETSFRGPDPNTTE